MAFRFIHTADIHLDSPLRSLALRDPALSDLIGTATRAAFVRIIDLCLAEAVDALLIAGDLYDGQQTSMKTARFLGQQLQRLEAGGVRAFIIRGNHDALSKITRELVLPPSVTLFGPKAETHLIETGGRPVAVHGISFAKPQAPESLLGRFPAPLADTVNIGMLHTSLAGAPGHDPYAPCALADLNASGYDYWALGHVHGRAEYIGAATVVMPGMPQGRDIGEAGEKSVTLVTVADDGAITLETRATGLAQFERVPVPLDGLTDWADLVAAIGRALARARRDHGAEHLVLRPVLTGPSALSWRVLRDLDLLQEEARLAAEALDGVWIDKLENASTAGQGAAGAGPLADLADQMPATLTSPALAAAAEAELTALLRALPRPLRPIWGEDEAAQAETRARLMREGAAEVLAVLAAAPEGDG
ncbi:metallophosphoesterase family protein [Phaeovulum sp.]|uniref:metallophosphoesterase family protein n=1 Tax=Phaeovulum sp. TaxID=2934796 RepID=UPI0039E2EA34